MTMRLIKRRLRSGFKILPSSVKKLRLVKNAILGNVFVIFQKHIQQEVVLSNLSVKNF